MMQPFAKLLGPDMVEICVRIPQKDFRALQSSARADGEDPAGFVADILSREALKCSLRMERINIQKAVIEALRGKLSEMHGLVSMFAFHRRDNLHEAALIADRMMVD